MAGLPLFFVRSGHAAAGAAAPLPASSCCALAPFFFVCCCCFLLEPMQAHICSLGCAARTGRIVVNAFARAFAREAVRVHHHQLG